MIEWETEFGEKSRLRVPSTIFGEIGGPRPAHHVAYPLPEVLVLAVCRTMADCDNYEEIGA